MKKKNIELERNKVDINDLFLVFNTFFENRDLILDIFCKGLEKNNCNLEIEEIKAVIMFYNSVYRLSYKSKEINANRLNSIEYHQNQDYF